MGNFSGAEAKRNGMRRIALPCGIVGGIYYWRRRRRER